MVVVVVVVDVVVDVVVVVVVVDLVDVVLVVVVLVLVPLNVVKSGLQVESKPAVLVSDSFSSEISSLSA